MSSAPRIEQEFTSAREQRIRQATAKNLENITVATNALNDLAGEDRVKMPEKIFTRYFLPMFAAEEEGTYPPNAMAEWLRISNNGLVEVDIVDVNNKVLVTMPARYSRGLVNVRTNRTTVSLFDSLQTFTDLATSSPIRAMNYYHRVIQPTTIASKEQEERQSAYMSKLKAVLTHFGKNTDFLNYTEPSQKDKPGAPEQPKAVEQDYIVDDSDLV